MTTPVHMIRAADDAPDHIHAAAGGEIRLVAAEGEKPARVKVTAYTGRKMHASGFYRPVVINLAGITLRSEDIPILLDHDPSRPVGHVTASKIDGSGVSLDVEMSAGTEWTKQVEAALRGGFPYRASVGAVPTKYRFVEAGKSEVINGQKHDGPFVAVDESELYETSFVAVAADSHTSSRLAAKGNTMKFSDFIRASGADPKAIDKAEFDRLLAKFKAEHDGGEVDVDEPKPVEPANTPAQPAQPVTANHDPDAAIKAHREQVAAEHARIDAVAKVAASHPEIKANAIRQGWTAEKTELEVLRAGQRASTPGEGAGLSVSGGEPVANRSAILASALMNVRGLSRDAVTATLGAEAVTAGASLRIRGLKDMLRAGLYMAGKTIGWNDGDEALIRASVGTNEVRNLLGDYANKSLLAAYEEEPSYWAEVCRVNSVNDFKPTRLMRLSTDGTFQKIGNDGELPLAKLKDEAQSVQADTWGMRLGISRQDVINDDLGAFDSLAQQIGRVAKARLNTECFTLLMSNPSSFFSSGNGNVSTGAGSALGVTGIGNAVAKLAKLKAPDGYNIPALPDRLLVPPELDGTARQLYASANLITGESKTQGQSNPYVNAYRPVMVPYLSDASITGNSTAQWYLLGAPTRRALMNVAFLRGVQTPTVEEVPGDAGILGMYWRAFFDFGFAMGDKTAGVRSAGS